MIVVRRQVGNTDYQLSDHQYLLVEVDLDDDDVVLDQDRAYATWLLRRKNGSSQDGRIASTGIIIGLAVLVVVSIWFFVNRCT
jgi:hypothetical protein